MAEHNKWKVKRQMEYSDMSYTFKAIRDDVEIWDEDDSFVRKDINKVLKKRNILKIVYGTHSVETRYTNEIKEKAVRMDSLEPVS